MFFFQRRLKWKKAVMPSVLAVVLVFGAWSPMAVHAASEVNIQINDHLIDFPDAQPFVDDADSRLYVPIRFVSEHLGFQIDWRTQGEQFAVSLSGNGLHLDWLTGDTSPMINGSREEVGVAALFRKGRVYVPFRFMTELAGSSVQWDAPSCTAIASTDGVAYMAMAAPKRAQQQQPELGPEMTFRATAYSSNAAENGGWGAVDYLGNPLELGTIAVDPDVIPLGTKVYISGFSFAGLPTGGFYAEARDIGGSIKDNRIDIFIPGPRKEVMKFGIQNVTVRIVR